MTAHRARRILAVDDDPEHPHMLAALLRGYVVDAAATAAGALRMARSRPYDLYILDYHLPDIDGLALCRRIKHFDPNTPVLMLSADDIRGRSVHAGADGAVVKGCDPKHLVDAVALLVAQQVLRNDSARAAEEAAVDGTRSTADVERAAHDRATSRKVREMEAEVRAARLRLEDMRRVRAEAFRTYVDRGGARGGFVEQWPQLAASGAGHDRE